MHWGYGQDDKDECYHGNYETREEAVTAAVLEGNCTVPFYVCQGAPYRPHTFMPDCDEIIEIVGERASAAVGEVADDWPPIPEPQAAAELEAFLAAWADKHLVPCDFWIAENFEEITEVPAELLAERSARDAEAELRRAEWMAALEDEPLPAATTTSSPPASSPAPEQP